MRKSKKIYSFLFVSAIFLIVILALPDSAYARALADQVRSEMVVGLWRSVLSIVNIVAIIGLIAIAIANILRVQIETYNIRRMLPTLVLAIILANFSHLICRFMIDFAQVFTNFFIYDNAAFHGDINGINVAKAFGLHVSYSGTSAVIGGSGALIGVIAGFLFVSFIGGFLIYILFGLIIVLIPSFLVFILSLMMYVRLYVIWFLVILSPLAFFAFLFEPLKSVWGFWWNWFLKWLFLAPVGFFFLRLAVEIGFYGSAASEIGGAASAEGISNFATWMFGLGMVFFALYVPFVWGGPIMNAVKGGIGKALAGANLGRKVAGAAGIKMGERLQKKGGAWGKVGGGLRALGKGSAASPQKALELAMQDVEEESDIAILEHGLYGGIIAKHKRESELWKLAAAKLDPSLDTETLTGIAGTMGIDQVADMDKYKGFQKYVAGTLRGRYMMRMEHGDELARQFMEKSYAPYLSGAQSDTNIQDRGSFADKRYYDHYKNWDKFSYRRVQGVGGNNYAVYKTPGGALAATGAGGGGGGGGAGGGGAGGAGEGPERATAIRSTATTNPEAIAKAQATVEKDAKLYVDPVVNIKPELRAGHAQISKDALAKVSSGQMGADTQTQIEGLLSHLPAEQRKTVVKNPVQVQTALEYMVQTHEALAQNPKATTAQVSRQVQQSRVPVQVAQEGIAQGVTDIYAGVTGDAKTKADAVKHLSGEVGKQESQVMLEGTLKTLYGQPQYREALSGIDPKNIPAGRIVGETMETAEVQDALRALVEHAHDRAGNVDQEDPQVHQALGRITASLGKGLVAHAKSLRESGLVTPGQKGVGGKVIVTTPSGTPIAPGAPSGIVGPSGEPIKAAPPKTPREEFQEQARLPRQSETAAAAEAREASREVYRRSLPTQAEKEAAEKARITTQPESTREKVAEKPEVGRSPSPGKGPEIPPGPSDLGSPPKT